MIAGARPTGLIGDELHEWKDLLGRPGFPQACFERCGSFACFLLGCRHKRPSNVTTNALTPSEAERQARKLLDQNVSRQVRRRIARKGG